MVRGAMQNSNYLNIVKKRPVVNKPKIQGVSYFVCQLGDDLVEK